MLGGKGGWGGASAGVQRIKGKSAVNMVLSQAGKWLRLQTSMQLHHRAHANPRVAQSEVPKQHP